MPNACHAALGLILGLEECNDFQQVQRECSRLQQAKTLGLHHRAHFTLLRLHPSLE